MEDRRTNPLWLPVCAAMAALTPALTRADESPRPTLAPQPSMSSSSVPPARPAVTPGYGLLRPGATVMLRVRQMLPADGFSPGERLLNGRQPIQPGDRFLAEVIKPPSTPPALVGGTIVKVEPPRRFGHPGRLTLQMAQVVEKRNGTTELIPWRFDTEDRRFATRRHRALVTALFGLEGAGVGASLATQFARANPVFIGGGAGVGVILGLCYTTFQRGTEANLESGDAFEVVVGTTSFRPVPRTALINLYPAAEPSSRQGNNRP